jgi:hypothetical protein
MSLGEQILNQQKWFKWIIIHMNVKEVTVMIFATCQIYNLCISTYKLLKYVHEFLTWTHNNVTLTYMPSESLISYYPREGPVTRRMEFLWKLVRSSYDKCYGVPGRCHGFRRKTFFIPNKYSWRMVIFYLLKGSVCLTYFIMCQKRL